VLLPAEQESVAPFTVNESITELARGEGLVLVIDDEVAIRSAVQNSLEDLDPKDVISALTAAGAQPVPTDSRRRWHLHFSIGATF
jgi:aspartate oxidase